VQPAAVQVRLGFCRVTPVEHFALLQLAEAERDLDVGMPVLAAGLEQQHRRACIFGQAVRQHTAGRAGADDDVIIAGRVAHDVAASSRRRVGHAMNPPGQFFQIAGQHVG
jgi:hypothetical protein